MDPFVPQFYEDVHHYPAYHPDGSPNLDKSYRTNVQRRQFATPDTAEWVGREFNASAVFPKTYLDIGEAFDINETSVKQYMATINGHDFTAGEIAYYFTQREPGDDVSQENQVMDERGMWPSDMPVEQVMIEGKKQADKFIATVF